MANPVVECQLIEADFRSGSLGGLPPLRREELPEERPTLLNPSPRGDGDLVVQPGVGAQVVQGAARAGAGVDGAEDQATEGHLTCGRGKPSLRKREPHGVVVAQGR